MIRVQIVIDEAITVRRRERQTGKRKQGPDGPCDTHGWVVWFRKDASGEDAEWWRKRGEGRKK